MVWEGGGICSALGPIVWDSVGGNSHTKMHWRAMYPTRGVDHENIFGIISICGKISDFLKKGNVPNTGGRFKFKSDILKYV